MILEGHLPLFGAQEVFAISQKHVFDTWLQDNRAHGTLLTSSIPTPASVGPWNRMRYVCAIMRSQNPRVSHENMNAVFRILLVLALCLEDEFLQNVIVTSNDTAGE